MFQHLAPRIALAVLAACGRVGFDAETSDSVRPPDASIDTIPMVPELRAMTGQESSGTGVQVDIMPTQPDHPERRR